MSLLLSGEERRRSQRAGLIATIHGESLLLRVQVRRAGASGVDVVVGALRKGDEGEPLTSGRERGIDLLLSGAVIARLSKLCLLRGLAGTSLSELKFHLGHALGGKLELPLHVLHGRSVVTVGGGGAAASRWRASKRVGALGGDVVCKRHAASVLGVLLLVELGHELA